MAKWKLKAGWKDETTIDNERANFIYKIILDFASEEQAINFRLNFRDWYDDNGKNNEIPFDVSPRDTYKNITLTKFELNDIRNGDIYWLRNKLPLNTTHFEFNISLSVNYKNNEDNNNLEQQYKQIFKSMFEKNFNAQTQVEFIPPKMKDLKDNTGLADDIQNRKDTLFEGLSTSELKHYDFIIVGRTQEEVDKLNKRYIQIMNDSFRDTWLTMYKTKEDIKKSDYDNKKGDMAYLKTKSDTLDSGIYCFSTRARNYFQGWKYNFGKEMLLPVFLDAKASQLGGKVVVAKKENNKMANKWKLKSSLKKKASEEILIPNSKVGLYCSIYHSVFDNLIYATLNGTLIGGANTNSYTFDLDNEYKHPNKETINTNKLKEDIMNELKPYIEELGNKFNEIMKSKGFIKK